MTTTKQKINPPKEDEEVGTDFKQKFKEIKEKKIADRTVTVKYKSCCGCGCDWVKVQMTVPFDSPIQDGQKVERSQFTKDAQII